MNNKEKMIVWNLFWFLAIFIMTFGSYHFEEVRIITFMFLGMVGLFYGLSFTEFGPFTQLPNGRYLSVKRGQRIVKYYLNQEGWGVATDDMTFVPDPEGKYQEYLKSGFLGFFYKYLGMVYTGFPFIGGVKGSMVYDVILKFSQKDNGELEYKTVDVEPSYHTAPPFLRNFAFILGAIPSKHNNTWNFAIPARIRITNPNDYDHRLINNPNNPIKGTFESALRPLVKKLKTKKVLSIKSEDRKDQNSIAWQAKDSANDNMRAERYGADGKNAGGYGYGVELHDVDFQVIEPADPEFAKVIRMKEFAQEVGDAKVLEARLDADARLKTNEADVKIIQTKGEAEATAQKLFVEATGNNNAAWLAKGMGDLSEGVTIVLGQNGNVIGNIPLSDRKKPNTKN